MGVILKILAFVAKVIAVLLGFDTTDQRGFWAKRFGDLGFAGIVAGIGVIVYHKLPGHLGQVAVECGIFSLWLGAQLSRKGK